MSRWCFVVSAAKNRLSGAKATYAVRIQHMDVVRGTELYKEIAQYLAINSTLAEGLVNGIGEAADRWLLVVKTRQRGSASF